MEKISISRGIAIRALEILAQTVSAGHNTPADSSWYTILSVRLASVCRMRRDLKNIDALATISADVKVDMLSNPIGALIYPSSILTNFNFKELTPSDAKIISTMIRKKPVDIADKHYEATTDPVPIYDLMTTLHMKRFVKDLREAAQKEEDSIIELHNDSISEFIGRLLYEANKQNSK